MPEDEGAFVAHLRRQGKLSLCLMTADPQRDADLFVSAWAGMHENIWCDPVSFRASIEQDTDFIGRLYRATLGRISAADWVRIVSNEQFTCGEVDRVNPGNFLDPRAARQIALVW